MKGPMLPKIYINTCACFLLLTCLYQLFFQTQPRNPKSVEKNFSLSLQGAVPHSLLYPLKPPLLLQSRGKELRLWTGK